MHDYKVLKRQLADKIRTQLSEEATTIQENPMLRIRLEQLNSLLKLYNGWDTFSSSVDKLIERGAIVMMVEEWPDSPRERWYFVGFGGEAPVQFAGRIYQIVAAEFFQGKSAGETIVTQEVSGVNDLQLNHRIVYVK